MMERNISFGKTVKRLRKQHRITQRQLAELLEVNFTYISKIENDRLDAPPSEKLIRKTAQVLETDPEELLELAGKIDFHELQDIAKDIPDASAVLRRMQSRQLTQDQWSKIKHMLEDKNNGGSR